MKIHLLEQILDPKLILAMFLILLIFISHWYGKIEDSNAAVKFIQWIYTAYVASVVGDKGVQMFKRK